MTVRLPTSGLHAIRRGEAGFENVRDVYSATGDPDVVLLPRSTDDVARALDYGLAAPGPLSIRSGGHGISSIATNVGGTVIDLRQLDAVAHQGGDLVSIGPGARWGSVARSLFEWGLALTSGDSGDVGVGGLATTGGIGLLGRAQGLTIDRMRAAEIVTAGGRIVRASEDEHPDLFWAIRGAGANVGIVTNFEFEAGRTPIVARATITYELADTAGFLSLWGETVEASPREVSAFLYAVGGGRPFAQATVVVADGDAAKATRALAPFSRLAGVVGAAAEIVPYPAVPLTSAAPHTGQQTAVMHTALVTHLDKDLVMKLSTMIRGDAVQMIQIRSAGGAINDQQSGATAYAHRHQNFSVTAVSDTAGAAFDAAWEPVRARRDGDYLSFESYHRPDDVEAAFPPPTLERLRVITREWDPDDVFSQNFDVTVR